MALTHPHPSISITKDGSHLWTQAQMWTADVTVPSLEAEPAAHFRAILKGLRPLGSEQNGALRGKFLEMCVYDFVVKTVLAADGDSGLVETGVDVVPGEHAEASVLVNNRLALLVKTSYRERWKQTDRDALVMTWFNGPCRDQAVFRVWSVFFAEKDDHGLRTVQSKAASVEKSCHANITVVSIIDEAKLQRLADEIRWALS